MKTVAQLITEAVAQIDKVTPAAAAAEIAESKVTILDVREPVEWEHHLAEQSRYRADCSSSSPIPPAHDTTLNSIPPSV